MCVRSISSTCGRHKLFNPQPQPQQKQKRKKEKRNVFEKITTSIIDPAQNKTGKIKNTTAKGKKENRRKS